MHFFFNPNDFRKSVALAALNAFPNHLRINQDCESEQKKFYPRSRTWFVFCINHAAIPYYCHKKCAFCCPILHWWWTSQGYFETREDKYGYFLDFWLFFGGMNFHKWKKCVMVGWIPDKSWINFHNNSNEKLSFDWDSNKYFDHVACIFIYQDVNILQNRIWFSRFCKISDEISATVCNTLAN